MHAFYGQYCNIEHVVWEGNDHLHVQSTGLPMLSTVRSRVHVLPCSCIIL